MGARGQIITRRPPLMQDGPDRLDRWASELRLVEEAMRCSRVLAWARAPRRAQSRFLKQLAQRLQRLDAEMQADDRR